MRGRREAHGRGIFRQYFGCQGADIPQCRRARCGGVCGQVFRLRGVFFALRPLVGGACLGAGVDAVNVFVSARGARAHSLQHGSALLYGKAARIVDRHAEISVRLPLRRAGGGGVVAPVLRRLPGRAGRGVGLGYGGVRVFLRALSARARDVPSVFRTAGFREADDYAQNRRRLGGRRAALHSLGRGVGHSVRGALGRNGGGLALGARDKGRGLAFLDKLSFKIPSRKSEKNTKSASEYSYRVNISDSSDLRREVDRILDKISSDGFASLTEGERRTLADARKAMKR